MWHQHGDFTHFRYFCPRVTFQSLQSPYFRIVSLFSHYQRRCQFLELAAHASVYVTMARLAARKNRMTSCVCVLSPESHGHTSQYTSQSRVVYSWALTSRTEDRSKDCCQNAVRLSCNWLLHAAECRCHCNAEILMSDQSKTYVSFIFAFQVLHFAVPRIPDCGGGLA